MQKFFPRSQTSKLKFVHKKNAKLSRNERVESMENDLASLKGEIGEIKSLLKELVNGK